MDKSKNLASGTLLVAGTTIGGGMLALPVLTSLGGFIPSIVVYLACWLFMACTGLLFMEVALWMKKDSNIVTMAENTLGLFGKISAWLLYLFLFYCLTLAYVVGSGDMVSELFNRAFSETVGSLIFVAMFAPIVYFGPRVVGSLNFYLMLALVALFCAFVFLGYSYVNESMLGHANWIKSLSALPIAFAAFAYQGIVPTLVHYLDYDAKKIKFSIIVGSFIPFVTYIIWQWLILGIVPTFGPGGLEEALSNGDNAVTPLKNFLNNPAIYVVGQFFAFFALLTSFLGVTVGLLDFLADGFRVEKTPQMKLVLCLMIFIPPIVLGYFHPGLFLQALDFAGGFGSALLLGLLPILMVWRGRYQLGYQSGFKLFGGKVLLTILALFVFFELAVEISVRLGYL